MTPEQMFRAFLEVWENELQWHKFEESNAINGLEKLCQIIQENINSDNATLEDKIWEWCEDYPVLTENIHNRLNRGQIKITRRPTLDSNHPLTNLYPDIPQDLQRRLNDNTPTPAQ